MHGGFHIGVQLCPEVARHHHRAADIAAKRERNENQCYFIAVADRRKRIVADKFSRNETVSNIIKLLKYYACKQRQTEPQKHLSRFADGQISV